MTIPPFLSRILIFILLFTLACLGPLYAQDFKAKFEKIRAMLPDQAIKADSLAKELLSESLANSTESDSMIAKSYYLLGIANYFRSKEILSVNYFLKALETDFGKKDQKVMEGCYNNLGVIYDMQDKIPEALDAYTRSLRIAEQRSDSFSMVQSWINISLLERKKNNKKRGVELCQMAIGYSQRHNDSLNLALGYQNLAMMYDDPASMPLRSDYNTKAYDIFKALNEPFYMVSMLSNMAIMEQEKGNPPKAQMLLAEALSIAEAKQLGSQKVIVILSMGKNALQDGDLAKAEELLLRAEMLAKTENALEMLDDIYLGLVAVYARKGDFMKHDKTLILYQDIIKSTNNTSAEAAYEQIKVIYELDKMRDQKLVLEDNIRERNRQLLGVLVLLGILIAAGAIIIRQYLRLQDHVKTLFRKNVEEMKQSETAAPIANVVDYYPETDPESIPSEMRFQKILWLLDKEKLYLNPDLSLNDLSMKLATNQKYISQAINSHSDTGFLGLVNRFRVNEARRQILELGTKANLHDVALNSGFSNRVSFYRQFKEITGISPSEFMKMAGN